MMKSGRCFFFLLIIAFVIVFTTTSFAQPGKKTLTVEEIFTKLSRQLFAKTPRSLQWLPEGEKFSYVRIDELHGWQELWIHDVKSGREERLVSNEKLIAASPEGDTNHVSLFNYIWLPKEEGLVLLDRGDIWYYRLSNGELKRLTTTAEDEELLQVSPDEKYIAFVRNFNLYIISLDAGKETQLTFDGHKDLLNGKLDWVYQEELVGRGKYQAFWWSPDSRHIAFLQFDESPVPHYPLVDWNPYHPDLQLMQYPKAGDPNPIVRIGVISVTGAKTVWIDTGENTDVYFPRVYWLPDGKDLAFMRLNRLQQHLEFLFADVTTGKSRVVLEESDPFWINIGDFVYFFKTRPQFLWGSERSGFQHLYIYDYNGKFIRQVTSGSWMVDRFLGVDESNDWIYFTATEKDVRERHLYRVRTDGTKFRRLTITEGTHSIRLAPNSRYYLDYYSHSLTPMEITLHRADGKRLRYILKDDPSILKQYALSLPEFFTLKGKNGIFYDAVMIKPPNFNPHKKYPVLIYVYGGPHGQVVRKGFGYTRQLWHHMLAQKGYIIFSMDNRGAWGRGHDWEKVIYRKMGEIELADQLQGVAYLKSLPFVDPDRIGIWGWSYGGYMTLYSLTHSRVFKTGISVAPVTDWRDYDTIYTERYMGLPQDNEQGYRNSSPVFFADSLHGKLLLIHGTYDDNVHLQNSLQMIDRLVDAGIPFQLMVYPNQKHGISATKDRVHLFNIMTHFLDENLKGESRSSTGASL